MRQALRIFILVCLIMLGIHVCADAQVMKIAAILNDPSFFDKKEVTIEAEVIGEALFVDSGAWINLSQDDIQIGVFVGRVSLLKAITHFGSYKAKGDIVRIKGIFYKSCPIHSERAIHLDTLTIVTPGFIKSDKVSHEKEIVLFVSLSVCLILLLLYFIKVKYVRRN